MKKPIISLVLIASVIPFAFYELDGPFGISKGIEGNIISKTTGQFIHHIEQLTLDSDLVLGPRGILEFENRHSYIFMYDKVNGYSIGYDASIDISNEQIVSFFVGNNSFKNGLESGWKDDYSKFNFYFWRERPGLAIKRSCQLLQGFEWRKYTQQRPTEEKLTRPRQLDRLPSNIIQWQKISLKSEFTTSLGMKFINKEYGPEITFEDKEMKLKDALNKYFKSKAQENFIDFIAKYKLKDNNKKSLMLNTYEMPNSTKIISDDILLGKSKLLAVYGVFKNKEGKESLIWGLAEVADDSQPTGKRKFHWITDIKSDVSELLKL